MGNIITDKAAAQQIGKNLHRFNQHIIKSPFPDLLRQMIHNVKEKGSCNPIREQAERIEQHDFISFPALHTVKGRDHDPHQQKGHCIIQRLRNTVDQKREAIAQHRLDGLFGKHKSQA